MKKILVTEKLYSLMLELIWLGYQVHFEVWRPLHLKITVKGPFNVLTRTNKEYSKCILLEEATEQKMCDAIHDLYNQMNTDVELRKENVDERE